MAVQSVKRGAVPTPRSTLAAASPYRRMPAIPLHYLRRPARMSFWGNDRFGDCVTAEEAFAKACHDPSVFVSDGDVIAWATRHGVRDGAYLTNVMDLMQHDGFAVDAEVYDDGPYLSVNWADATILRSAICEAPVKIGIAADQVEKAYFSTGGQSGWLGTGFQADPHEDHCVSLCGYGTVAWLAQQFGGIVPASVDGNTLAYAMFTWNSIGIVDAASMKAITHEAWIRRPTTVIVPGVGLSIASVQFPNVHLRMDGRGVTSATGSGGGTVNCQYGVGPWERFRLESQPDGTVAIASVQFPNVHLRMDGRGVTSATGSGGGTVNCQYGVGPWEKFQFQT